MTATSAALERSYLPVIDRPLDNTAMTVFMTCPREYFFSMILHRRSKGVSIPLHFGATWHKILEMHYRSGGDKTLALMAGEVAWAGHDATGDYRTLDRAFLDYERYVKEHGLPEDEARAGKGKTVGVGADALVELSTNAQGDELLHPWAGKMDRIIDLNGSYYIEDHKTTSRFDKNYFRQFELSNQMMGYTYLGRQLFPSLNIVGVRINLLHVLTEKSAFHRQLFTFNPSQIQEWAQNNNQWMRRLAWEYDQLQQHGVANGVPVAAFPGHYGDNGCSRKFGMCGYHPVCSSSPRARQHVLESDYDILPWNPLEADE